MATTMRVRVARALYGGDVFGGLLDDEELAVRRAFYRDAGSLLARLKADGLEVVDVRTTKARQRKSR